MTLVPGLEQDSRLPHELVYTCTDCGAINEPILVEFPARLGGAKYIRRRCQCMLRKNIEAVERAKNFERTQRYERYFSFSTLGKRFSSKSFENFKASKETAAALRKTKEFVNKIIKATSSDEERAQGVILIGPVGTGKSHLAAAAFNKLKESKACIFVNVPELLERIRASYSSKSNEREDDIVNAVKQCDVLILDDLGSERHKGDDDWATEKLFTIVDFRYRNMRPIFCTTNCQPNSLEDKIGPRIMSRLREICDLTPCLGEDYRYRCVFERRA
ncbi:prophage LambdaBa02, DNA replication DnaC domain protein [Desulfosporosinus sp. OT]|nr:prophage LambdaBa02, DNA replication DnaC domain protein [Desulfosporosinus sp. OT]